MRPEKPKPSDYERGHVLCRTMAPDGLVLTTQVVQRRLAIGPLEHWYQVSQLDWVVVQIECRNDIASDGEVLLYEDCSHGRHALHLLWGAVIAAWNRGAKVAVLGHDHSGGNAAVMAGLLALIEGSTDLVPFLQSIQRIRPAAKPCDVIIEDIERGLR